MAMRTTCSILRPFATTKEQYEVAKGLIDKIIFKDERVLELEKKISNII